MNDIEPHQLPIEYPEIFDMIVKSKWETVFTHQTYHSGHAYAHSNSVTNMRVEDAGNGDLIISAKVKGSASQYYNTRLDILNIAGRIHIETDCTCPVGYNCKHTAAILVHLVSLLKYPSLTERMRIKNIDDWLKSLAQPTPQANTAPKKSPPETFIAYCLTVYDDEEDASTIELFQGRILKSGEHSINFNQNAIPNFSKPGKYIKDRDILPLFKIQSAVEYRHSYYYGAQIAIISGHLGAEILLETLATGHLYCLDSIEENHSHTKRLRPLTLGSPIQPQLDWQHNDDGTIAPIIRLPDGIDQLSVTPPLFIDTNPQAPTLHQLDPDCGFSVEQITSWENGPTIPAENIPNITKKISTLSSAIPVPKSIALETLKKSPPTPHLTIRRQNPFIHGGLHLSGQPEPIIIELSFLYHGQPYTPDLATNTYTEKSFVSRTAQAVLTIPRSIAAEKKALAFIAETSNYIPASQLDSQVKLDHRAAFLPGDHPRYWEQSAAQFIASFLPKWQARGHTFTIDESAHLDILEIADDHLFTDLNELPDHGIDWFSFDAGYLTPKGQKCSMLDLIGQLLQSETFQPVDPETIPADERIILRDPATRELISFPAQQIHKILNNIQRLFGTEPPTGELHRVEAATLADAFDMDSSETIRALANLGEKINNFTTLPRPAVPKALNAKLRDYQLDGYHWLQFLARYGLHGILADDMGLGKTLQTLAHIQAEISSRHTDKKPSLVIAPTSVVGNWIAEAGKFTPKLKTLLLNGSQRHSDFKNIPKHHLVVTSYALVVRDFDELSRHDFHLIILDEAQYIKNPNAQVSRLVCQLPAKHRISLSGTPLENHLGELWSQMRFLMPGLLGNSDQFTKNFRTPIEKHHDTGAQKALNNRVAPLILRRTKDQVATELPKKTVIVQTIALNPYQIDLYETIRAAMDKRVRDAIAEKGLAKSHIIVLDALLKLRQICCHPQLLKLPEARNIKTSAKLDHLIHDLLPTLLEEGRKILLFSSFTSMLAIIEERLIKSNIPFAKITGSTRDRQAQIDAFQNGDARLFLISLKAGGTGLNLTAADTVIHYDPWWNPAAENQATDRAHRIGQKKPVFVYKLITEGSIEQRIIELQEKKAALVESLLTDSTNKLKIDQTTLQNLFAPIA